MARRIGEPRTTRQPARTSSRIGSRSTIAGLGGSSLRIVARSAADATNERASNAIAIGRRQYLDEKSADSEAGELRDRRARGERAVRDDEPALLDDGREIGDARGVEERREDRGEEGDDQQLGQAQHAGKGGHGDRAEKHGAAEVRHDHDRPSSQPIDPRAGEEPEHEPADHLHAPERGDLQRASTED